MLRLEDVTLVVGTRTLFEGATWHLRPGERVGLVGRNGAGKSSLLRLFTGELEAAGGEVHTRNGIRLGYLPQQAVSGSSASVWDEARSGMTRLNELADALARSEAAVAAGEEGAVERHDRASEQFRLAGGFAADERVGEVLFGLGFATEDWTKSCDTFSGGWQMRIALARMLLSEPDVLLLDEPTNHLDLTARSWLARFLAKSSATQVIVSHDRHLLDGVCTTTVEVRHRRLERFSGGLTAWLAERALREAQTESTRAKQLEEVAKLERFVERFGAKATKAAQAQSRKKQLEKIEVVAAPERDSAPRFTLPEAPGCSREVLVTHDASVGWGDTAVLTGVNLVIERGERWAILGPNGVGKSTLLHALAGRQPLLGGRRTVGRDVRLAVYAQDLAQELPVESTALDEVLRHAPASTPQQARQALGALGLSGDMALRPIGGLSGGEKARVVLAGLARRPTNVLLLDEPTNHLDVMTVDVLAEALASYEGAVVLVTHDRWLVERLATHVAVVADGTVTTHIGVQPGDLEPVTTTRPSTTVVSEDGPTDHELRKERKRMQRRLDKLSKEMDALGERIDKLDAELFDAAMDHVRATELGEKRRTADAQMEALFEEMGELEAQLTAE